MTQSVVTRNLALHDWPDLGGAGSYYRLLLDIAEQLSIELTDCSIGINDKVTRKSLNWLSTQDDMALSNVTTIVMYNAMDRRAPKDFEWNGVVSWTKRLNGRMRMHVGISEGAFNVSLSIADKINRVISNTRPIYGYEFNLPLERRPALFIDGIVYRSGDQSIDHNYVTRVSDWATHAYRPPYRYRGGLLRDIFDVNILSNVHRGLIIDGVSLFDWILEGRRGSLVEIGDKNWIWRVNDQDMNNVRDELIERKMLAVSV